MRAKKTETKKAKRSADPMVAEAAELIVEAGLSDPWVHASLKARGVAHKGKRNAIIRAAHELIASEDAPESPSVQRARVRAALVTAYEQQDWARADKLRRELAELIEHKVKSPSTRTPDALEETLLAAMEERRAGRMTSRQFAEVVKGVQAVANLIYAEAATKTRADEEEDDASIDGIEGMTLSELSKKLRVVSK